MISCPLFLLTPSCSSGPNSLCIAQHQQWIGSFVLDGLYKTFGEDYVCSFVLTCTNLLNFLKLKSRVICAWGSSLARNSKGQLLPKGMGSQRLSHSPQVRETGQKQTSWPGSSKSPDHWTTSWWRGRSQVKLGSQHAGQDWDPKGPWHGRGMTVADLEINTPPM